MVKPPIISFENFTFQYDGQSEPTLFDINLDIFPGEKIVIIGASGSGKSTLGKCLNGLIPYGDHGDWQGSVKIKQHLLGEASIFDLSHDVGTVLQDTNAQFIGLTVAEDIAFSLENDTVSQTSMKKRVGKWAEKLNLRKQLNHEPHALSGGQKQRVSMAGVLIDEGEILLFDEPLASLDPTSGLASIELIDELHHQLHTTVVIIEHRLEDVLHRPVDRVVVMSEGRIVFNQDPDTLLRSNILAEYGLREPQYITALKKAKCDLSTFAKLTPISSLDVQASEKEKLKELSTKLNRVAFDKKQETVLAIQELHFSYDQKSSPVFQGLNCEIKKGEMVALIGENGAGKSTLSQLICGFLKPDQGEILFNGKNLADFSIKERADKIGYIMQDPDQMISKTKLYDEVALGLVLRGYSEELIQDKVFQVLRLCGLYEYRNWPISALSYGQKKRVTIAAILVLEPELLIMDEPTAGQDYRHYTEIMEFIQELNKGGVTILFITHDMHLMLEYTHRGIVLGEKQILRDASPIVVLNDPDLVATASLAKPSLLSLAELFELPLPLEFVESFIHDMRKEEPNHDV